MSGFAKKDWAHKPSEPIVSTRLENLRVLFEDNHIIIINKRSSDIIQGDKTGDVVMCDIVKEYVKKNTTSQAKFFWEPFTG